MSCEFLITFFLFFFLFFYPIITTLRDHIEWKNFLFHFQWHCNAMKPYINSSVITSSSMIPAKKDMFSLMRLSFCFFEKVVNIKLITSKFRILEYLNAENSKNLLSWKSNVPSAIKSGNNCIFDTTHTEFSNKRCTHRANSIWKLIDIRPEIAIIIYASNGHT